uniref:DUF6536 domain-containing protein n=1 Tax=Colletotrichum fructicola (strain Nara gc5) TaxID=1213859 RepID=L2GAD5_COLFN
MARKREEKKRQTEGGELAAQAAERYQGEGFYDEATTHSMSTASASEDLERMMPPGGKRGGQGTFSRMKSGWRAGIAVNIVIGFIILIVAIVCLVLALVVVGMVRGESRVYEGSCSKADEIKIGLSVAINVIVIILLATANYFFQVLSSPTRTEVEMAHEEHRWLHIGVPSFRNLRFISKPRVVMAVIIMMTAVSTQVMSVITIVYFQVRVLTVIRYNAVIFTTMPGFAHQILFVTPSFLSSGQFSNASATNAGGLSRSDILTLQTQASQNNLTNITIADCLNEFGGVYQGDFSAVLLVTDSASTSNSLVQTAKSGSSLSQFVDPTNPSSIKINDTTAEYCLARPESRESCSVILNGSLLGVIAILNLVSVSAIGAVYFFTGFEPLVTLGDALASFITHPDHTTKASCLLDKKDVTQGRWGYNEAKYWTSKEHFWFQTPSLSLWAAWFLTCPGAAPIGLAAAALAISLSQDTSASLSAFGHAPDHQLYILPNGAARAGFALVAALPHLLVAVLYLTTNILLSSYFLSHELSHLYLTLPRPFSWLLLVLFAAAGFVLSQSVVMISVDSLPAAKDADFPAPINGVGFSGVGLLALLALLVIIAGLVLGLGLRRADPTPTRVDGDPSGNPLVLKGGSCSAVISARCHRSPGDVGAACREVAWGVVAEGEGTNVGHATFSSLPVTVLNPVRSYA